MATILRGAFKKLPDSGAAAALALGALRPAFGTDLLALMHVMNSRRFMPASLPLCEQPVSVRKKFTPPIGVAKIFNYNRALDQ
jgi:hypothetical protein